MRAEEAFKSECVEVTLMKSGFFKRSLNHGIGLNLIWMWFGIILTTMLKKIKAVIKSSCDIASYYWIDDHFIWFYLMCLLYSSYQCNIKLLYIKETFLTRKFICNEI